MHLKVTVKYGIYMGLALCSYTIFMWLTRLDTAYLYIGQYLDIAILFLPLTIMLLAVRSAQAGHRISIFARFTVVIGIGLISFVIYSPFLYAYHNYINPTWFDAVLSLQEKELTAKKVEPAQISEQLRKLKEANDAQSGILGGFVPSVIILPIFVGLMTWPFSRNRKRVEKQPMNDPAV
jgi:hypothetical protein